MPSFPADTNENQLIKPVGFTVKNACIWNLFSLKMEFADGVQPLIFYGSLTAINIYIFQLVVCYFGQWSLIEFPNTSIFVHRFFSSGI